MDAQTNPATEPFTSLIALWMKRSLDALPADAMLINRHIRELAEAVASHRDTASLQTPPYSSESASTTATGSGDGST